MINLTHEEAEQVLDALEKGAWDTLRGRNAAELLRARLSEPDPHQDWMERERAVGYREGHQAALKQREWVGLTDEEALKEFWKIYTEDDVLFTDVERAFYRAIEAKLKEKNT
jgi:hypothetical protein